MTPTCKRCGQQHFNFVACDTFAAGERERLRRRVIPVWGRPEEGLRDWVPSGPPVWGETRLSRVLKNDGPETG